ncbi:MarR family winged helix-turn-helix transcriptional regulator [Marininema halotolerans]|uniref:DNA-binding transcriptional regulator, MarR family n=1 Tax=Marininema halotolerans TaxID=1155944 RepID=A0A1I6PCL3_9BACL|nr:MarR family transcriptional regulator [Marininema halotolerans]SFS37835.1 DNA-binding transcriptional regulator, MarR family [Marininema halotolerans]
MSSKPRMLLSDQLCFAIYACYREICRIYRPLLDKLDLTYPQYLVLLALWEHEKLSIKELGQHLQLDSGTLTPMLKRMESANLVIRKRCLEDERKVWITLTEKGIQLEEKVACIPETLIEKSGVPEEQFLHMRNQLQELQAHLHQMSKSE